MEISSASSGRSSASSRLRGEVAASPIPYREKPLEYWPPRLCKCREKAACWISWSDDNPGRRYLTCMRRRAGGCDFWVWYEDSSTTPFVRQLLVDSRDKVWGLKREKKELLDALGRTKEKVDEQKSASYADLRVVNDQLEAKDRKIVELIERVRRLEKQRCMFFYAFAGCVAVLVWCVSWM